MAKRRGKLTFKTARSRTENDDDRVFLDTCGTRSVGPMGAPGKDNGYMLLIRDEFFTCCRTDKDADRAFLDTCGPKGVGSMVVTGKGSECTILIKDEIFIYSFVFSTN